MFFRIIGILWIILGIWWIMRPQGLKRRFSRKLKKTRRRILFFVIIIISGIFLSAARYSHGIFANILLIIGILGVVKAFFFLTSKASDKIIDWWLEKPLWLWRVWAGGFVLIGLLLQKIAP